MKRCMLFGLMVGIVLWQSASGQYVLQALPPEDLSSMPIYGANQRLSHTSPYEGPTIPQVRWVASGGAINEPTHLSNLVIAPQMSIFGAVRFPYYGLFDAQRGLFRGSLGPFWGQLSSLTIFNTAVYVFGANDELAQVIPDWPVYIMTGGQYDARVISPSPVFGFPDLDVTIRGVPAYRSGFGVYTDGLMGNAVLGDHFGNLFGVAVYWVVSDRYIGPYVGIDFGFTPIPFIPSAVLSSAVFNEHNDSGFAGYHNGFIIGYNTYAIPQPGPSFRTSVMQLSQADRVDPNDPNSDPDPIPSDSVDRPIVFNANNTIAYVCASNYGRIYAIDALDGDRIWGVKLDPNRQIPIMGGPSLGTDSSGNEVLYVVGRSASNRSTLYALDAQTGALLWSRALPNVSRCTPTVDAQGRLYFGDERGFLYCYDSNGNQIWRLAFGAAINVSPVLMSIPDGPDPDLNPDTVLVVAVSNRYLICIQQRVPPSPVGGTIGTGQIGSGAQ